ncbi:MAG: [acyl-carrier-protein] S-malonyltransferase [Candidatus Methylumidiphilus alinenensis]|uniref:Malonyl CoA-acyl carrier protein transacylase n=1 Tax=Candidatus Methylumidiphilus alinenensis TaxID=2202197 RepID=A0A2W4RDP2_9GAMM|nr:MAG: [acyl-carrier-protein] S-malonyltransferase [Candidatus Methylumidiphilus alinenensis]
MNKTDNGLAFVFPGQGSQSVGMLGALAAEHPEVAQVFGTASEVLGYDLWRLATDGPAGELNLTQHTQPAMLAAGVAAYRVWAKVSDVQPRWMAGHSLGEFSALVCAGVVDFAQAVELVAKRAKLMQGAVEPGIGAMAAVLGLDDAIVIAVCAEISTGGEVVTAANFNSPGQVVIAGHATAVSRAIDALKREGAKKAVLLPVSVPSHCPLMVGAAAEFREILANTTFHSSSIAVVHNVDVGSHSKPEEIRFVLEQQLYSPVRWSDTIRFLFEQGVGQFVECGPGKVLLGLNKRIVKDARMEAVFDPDSLNKALELVK